MGKLGPILGSVVMILVVMAIANRVGFIKSLVNPTAA